MNDKKHLFAFIVAITYFIIALYYINKSNEDKEKINNDYVCTIVVTFLEYNKDEHEHIRRVDTISFFMSSKDRISYKRMSNTLRTEPNDYLFLERVSDYRIIEKTLISSEKTNLP